MTTNDTLTSDKYKKDFDPIRDVILPEKGDINFHDLRGRDINFLCLKVTEKSEINYNITYVDSEYQVKRNDRYILANGTFDVFLPAPADNGKKITIKNVGSGTITVKSDEYIDVATSLTLPNNYDYVSMVYFEEPSWKGWNIVSQNP